MVQYNLKDNITELRQKGKSYNEISSILNCSKSLVCYYLGNNQKEKFLKRQRKNREKNPILAKLNAFINRKLLLEKIYIEKQNKIQKIISLKITEFKRRNMNGRR